MIKTSIMFGVFIILLFSFIVEYKFKQKLNKKMSSELSDIYQIIKKREGVYNPLKKIKALKALKYIILYLSFFLSMIIISFNGDPVPKAIRDPYYFIVIIIIMTYLFTLYEFIKISIQFNFDKEHILKIIISNTCDNLRFKEIKFNNLKNNIIEDNNKLLNQKLAIMMIKLKLLLDIRGYSDMNKDEREIFDSEFEKVETLYTNRLTSLKKDTEKKESKVNEMKLIIEDKF